jgi:AcrR family transcriptional regulator
MSTRKRARRSYHHGDLAPALLAAAGELLEKQGITSLSVREVAKRAGVSHTAPYRHFPDREALLAALAAQGFGRLGEALREAARLGSREMGAAYVRFALARPQLYRLMFGGLLRIEAHAELRQRAAQTYEGLVQAFAGLGAERRVEAAAAAWSLVHGLASLLLAGHFPRAALEGRGADSFVRAVLGAVRFAVGPAAQRSA